MRPYRNFPQLLRPIIIFEALIFFCNCWGWSAFSVFVSPGLVAVSTRGFISKGCAKGKYGEVFTRRSKTGVAEHETITKCDGNS